MYLGVVFQVKTLPQMNALAYIVIKACRLEDNATIFNANHNCSPHPVIILAASLGNDKIEDKRKDKLRVKTKAMIKLKMKARMKERLR